MSSWIKRIKFRLIQFAAVKLGWILIWLLGRSIKITYINRRYFDELRAGGEGFIVPIWHGRLLLPIFVHRNLQVVAMVSQSPDGELIARAIHKLGYRSVRGSSTRGGNEAFHQMLTELKKGAICTIMPDGPTGPRHRLKPGAIYLAQNAGVSILPLTYSADKFFQAKSWDRFMIAKPFSRGVIMYGEPIRVPENMTETEAEEFRVNLEQKLIELEKNADDFFQK
ncbi:lysophospholipid acyltransferase family protein [candidate division KSB1 bacterium]|nr:lysophospholipid acyltransferase family protein [candidate division KSB1 bacterium]